MRSHAILGFCPNLYAFHKIFVLFLHARACVTLQAEETVALHCGALLDPETDTVAHDVVVLTEGGMVKQILPAKPRRSQPTPNGSTSRRAFACLG